MVVDWRAEQTFLFKDDADHERFLDRLAERVEPFNIRLCLFVCMTNHISVKAMMPPAGELDIDRRGKLTKKEGQP